MKKTVIRIIADIILLIAFFTLPWWLALVLCAVSFFLVESQYEVIILAFLADASYGANASTGDDFQFLFLGITTLLFIISIILKPRLKFYGNI